MNDETGRDLVPHEGKLDLTTIKLTPTGGMEIVNAGQLLDMAKAMSKADIAVRKHLRGNPGACLGVLMQAMNWQMQPFLVASKSFLVNEQLGYEAQLLHAVVLKHAPIKGRPKIEFLGEGSERQVRVSAKLEDDEVVEYVSPKIKAINPKNSPLWVNDPDQQLAYYGVRGLARRHFPDVLMGAYAVDEMERTPYQGEMKGFNPLAAPHDGETIDAETGEVMQGTSGVASPEEVIPTAAAPLKQTGGVAITPAAFERLTGEEEPEVQQGRKRRRRTKAEIDAERAAAPQQPGDLVPATVPEAGLHPLVRQLVNDLQGAHTLQEWANVVQSYKPAYDDLRQNLPDVAEVMKNRTTQRQVAILKEIEEYQAPREETQDAPQEAQEQAPAEPATQVAPEAETPAEPQETTESPPWPADLEAYVAKWEHLPETRELCLFMWASTDAEDADERYAQIATRRNAIPDPLARRAVRETLSAVRRKYGAQP